MLNGYRNPSLPTPNPDIYPPPPVSTPVSSMATTTTTTTQTTTQSGPSAGVNTTPAASTPSATSETNTAASNTSSTPSNNIQDLQNCVPGSYTMNSSVRPMTNGGYYGGSNSAPPTMTYTVSGMQNGKCSLTVTQNAVVPSTIQNGSLVPSNTVSPAANVQTCNLSPSDLTTMVGQAQRTQTGGYYGTTPMGSNYYTKQSMNNSCSSFLSVNGAAIPYNNVTYKAPASQ